MNDFSIYKLAKGAYNISVEQGTKTSSVTGIVNNDITEDTASEKHYIKSTNPYAVSRNTILTATESSGNGKGFGNGFYPTTFAWHYDINKNHNNRIMTDRFHHSQLTPNVFIDGYADVYRIVDGVYKNVRTSKVATGNWGEWSTMHKGVTTTGLSLETKFAHWNGRNVTVWLGVAAIDSTGRAGAVGYLPTVIPTNKSNTSPVKDEFNTDISWSFGGSLPAPTGVTLTPQLGSEDVIMNSWEPVDGAVGYVVLVSWETDPASHPDKPYLELENDGGVALQKGDHTIIRKRIDNPSIDMISPRVYGDNASTKLIRSSAMVLPLNSESITGGFVEWGDDIKPDSSLGSMYGTLKINSGSPKTILLQDYWHGGSEQAWYTTLDPTKIYKYSCWIKVSKPVEVILNVGVAGVPTETFSLKPGWQQITKEFSPSTFAKGTHPFRWTLYYNTNTDDVVFGFSQTRMYDTSSDYLGLETEDKKSMKSGILLRDHSLIKPGKHTADVTAITNPSGESPKVSTLETLFKKCVQTGSNPWIQLEWHLSESDWLNILAYINAPVSSGHPMAIKRQSQGRTDPWADAFTNIYIEQGNEAWNGLGNFWNPPWTMTDTTTGVVYNRGNIYGLICRKNALAMINSPFWDNKIEWVLGGWNNKDFGIDAARTFKLPHMNMIADYNGGWESGDSIATETDKSYQQILSRSMLTNSALNIVNKLKDLAKEDNIYTYGENLFAGVYEAGPGYNLNGLNNAKVSKAETISQEVSMKSAAAGTATLHAFMQHAEKGLVTQNFFTLGAGDVWKSRAPAAHGGGGYMSWTLPTIIHEQMGEYTIKTSELISGKIISVLTPKGVEVVTQRTAVYHLESVTTPGRHMLVAINIDIQNTASLTVHTNFLSATSTKTWTYTGDFRDHNRYAPGTRLVDDGTFTEDVRCVVIDIQPTTNAVPANMSAIKFDESIGMPSYGLPKGGFAIVQFDGVVKLSE